MGNVLFDILQTVWGYLLADWNILLLGILMAAGIQVYVDPDKFRSFLQKKAGFSIPGSVAFGAFTPLCACGTMAVLISMFAAAMPWGPVMAFLISSPLTSPSEYLFQTAFFGTEFALAVLISSVVLGVAAGFLAHFLEKRTGFFEDQLRQGSNQKSSCCPSAAVESESCCTSDDGVIDIVLDDFQEETKSEGFINKYKILEFLKEFYETGIKKILFYFILFIAVGRVVELMVPKELIMSLFSENKGYSIPLGASVGLPLYVSGSASLPLMRSFMNSGAGQGALLAFLITGKATGVPVIAGMATFLKKKALLFYVGFIYLGGMLAGYLYQSILHFLG
ncbi:MAG: permease [Thermotaleaceae bacterium]